MSVQVWIGGVSVDKLTGEELASIMVNDAADELPYPKLVFSANGHGVSLSAIDSQFCSNLSQGDICHADGMWIVFATRLLTHSPLPERICTTDFFHAAARKAHEHKLKFYFLGAEEEVVRAAYRNAQIRYPNIEWVGYRNGYFDIDEEPAICREIVESDADVVWIGLGRPKQEAFCVRNRERLAGVAWMKTCGGLFDFLSGRRARAPRWMQSVGLEWVFRVMLEPRRLWWRYFVTNPHSLMLFITRGWHVSENTKRWNEIGK